ncbi:MAG: hypothetical protein ACFCA4_00240 [Cyanophyceae cyanobacterium]
MQFSAWHRSAFSPSQKPGWLDRLIGSGATSAELAVQFIPAFGAAIAAPVYGATLAMDWSSWQLGAIALLGFDIVGGVLTNATSAAKGWYHRPGQRARHHFGFVALHLFHIGLVSLLFRGADVFFFVGVSSFLLGAAALILASPLYLQRPIAFGMFGLALLGDRYFLTPTPGLEWFLPLFFLKLLVSHLLKETAYKPGDR